MMRNDFCKKAILITCNGMSEYVSMSEKLILFQNK